MQLVPFLHVHQCYDARCSLRTDLLGSPELYAQWHMYGSGGSSSLLSGQTLSFKLMRGNLECLAAASITLLQRLLPSASFMEKRACYDAAQGNSRSAAQRGKTPLLVYNT